MASVHPTVSHCILTLFCECVSECLSPVSADRPGYRVILHFGFFSWVFSIYLPQTCHTQGNQEEVKLTWRLENKSPHILQPRHDPVCFPKFFDLFIVALLCSSPQLFFSYYGPLFLFHICCSLSQL